MKKIILATLALIVFAGCVKDLPYENLPVPIQFNAGLSGVNTRAPIVSDGSNHPTSDIVGIQILRAADVASSPDWTVVNSVAATATVATDGSVGSVSSAQYYNANAGLNAFFMAFYPAAGSMSANTVNWTITGQEDIIVAPSVSAGNKASPVAAALAFAHKLTQLQFEVIASSATAQSHWGTLTSIKVNADTALELTLSTNALASASTPVNTDLSAAQSGVSFPLTIPTGTATAAGIVMVKPGTLGAIKVTTATSPEQTVSISGLSNTLAGNAHKITLTFNELGAITFTATLTDWVDGTDGTGSL